MRQGTLNVAETDWEMERGRRAEVVPLKVGGGRLSSRRHKEWCEQRNDAGQRDSASLCGSDESWGGRSVRREEERREENREGKNGGQLAGQWVTRDCCCWLRERRGGDEEAVTAVG
ncbi:hypothetical protein HN51_065088 [Arachis hypogaea]